MSKVHNLKVGDKVRVREDLVVGEIYKMSDSVYTDRFIGRMNDLKGKIVTICYAGSYYGIEEDGHNWTDDMFEHITVPKKEKPKSTKEEVEMKRQFIGVTFVDKVIFNDPATIVYYKETGSSELKRVVAMCDKDDTFDKEKGFAVALAKVKLRQAEKEYKKLLK